MIGYHFTTRANCTKIRDEGLVPYPLPRHQRDLAATLAEAGYLKVVWLWPEVPAGADLVGCVMDRVLAKHDTHITLLAVRYESDEVIAASRDGRIRYSFMHDGSMEHPCRNDAWVYHQRVPFVLLRDPVPADRIRVVGDFDLVKLFENNLAPVLTAQAAAVARSNSERREASLARGGLDAHTDAYVRAYGSDPDRVGMIPKSML